MGDERQARPGQHLFVCVCTEYFGHAVEEQPDSDARVKPSIGVGVRDDARCETWTGQDRGRAVILALVGISSGVVI